jgi:hypothetical protein
MKKMIALLCLLLMPLPAHAWGSSGHSVVAEIAQRELSNEARQAVDQLLDHATLGSVASWADDAKYTTRPDSFAWHFVNIPLNESRYVFQRDCKYKPSEGAETKTCLVTALEQLKNQLKCGDSQTAKRDALRFIVHLIGDSTQPLHTVLEESGGNDLKVALKFCGLKDKQCDHGPPISFHVVWDETLIGETVYSWGSYVTRLYNPNGGWLHSAEAQDPGLISLNVIDWINDSHAQAQTVWKKMLPASNEITQDYYDRAIKIVDRQLGLGGLRLARFLNDVYSSRACPGQ